MCAPESPDPAVPISPEGGAYDAYLASHIVADGGGATVSHFHDKLVRACIVLLLYVQWRSTAVGRLYKAVLGSPLRRL
jgi:hypothetical protein